MNHKDKLPEITRKRLLELYNLLNSWDNKKITTKEISNITGWKDSLVRHDLFLVNKLESEYSMDSKVSNTVKGVKNGYSVEELKKFLSSILEAKEHNCCIVGLGRLGAALLDENLLLNTGFHIKAGFDSNINRVEILRSTFPLYPANEMGYIIKRENIETAILTVSDSLAFNMTKLLMKAEIKGIVNMTNVVLPVDDTVKVQNLSIRNALQLVI